MIKMKKIFALGVGKVEPGLASKPKRIPDHILVKKEVISKSNQKIKPVLPDLLTFWRV